MFYNKFLELKDLIDFTDCPPSNRKYSGGSMPKIAILYNNQPYMAKMQIKGITHYVDSDNKMIMTYFNSIFSEHIASNFAKNIGFEAQETLLGVYLSQNNNRNRLYKVVACKDFLKPNETLFTFQDIINAYHQKPDNFGKDIKVETLKGTLEVIENQTFFDPIKLKEHFWNMFVFDGYIGNFEKLFAIQITGGLLLIMKRKKKE